MYMSGLHFENLLREGQTLNMKDFERGIALLQPDFQGGGEVEILAKGGEYP